MTQQTIKLALMDGDWYFSDDGEYWHVMMCSANEFMSNGKAYETCQVLYYEPVA